ncbi:hypothetical protein [Cohnella thailandensis]|uniref:Uncharacterized protein n=1 Tax=Cohnella thailandensis TaxID=557557 RepID=A0A841T3M2_9BACL|nr:hypothetical protein [Cohnella thailandensis]MBB6637446.1 hypothetical protein [Cohnella thailandensis]MBP1976776.1 drug/metabolite transporter (DMT)-like permease [Cohnella thailandensis]
MIPLIIAGSFLISTILSVRIERESKSKWLGMLTAFCSNAFILTSAWKLYGLDDETRMFGIDFQGRNALLLSIPILTWLLFMLLSYIRKRTSRR